jgi:membrane complex biogenesis BtpA family protein
LKSLLQSRNRIVSNKWEEKEMISWFADFFAVPKPVIAMAHLPALPGTPRYDGGAGIEGIVARVRHDVKLLLEGGVDAVMFCNEDDRPYVFQASIEKIATMTRVIAETRPQGIPYGVDFLWDPKAALAIAHATGASFVREVFSGLYESDMGLWAPNAGEALRFRRQIGADQVRVFFNVMPEFSWSLGPRDLALRAYSAVVSSLADVILVSGPMAGTEPDLTHVVTVKEAVGEVPVLLNTGAKPDNIEAYLAVADGVIVGSCLKIDGSTWNPVDLERVKDFMHVVHEVRAKTIAA